VKLVIEYEESGIYVMFETNAHHKKVKRRADLQVDPEILSKECSIYSAMQPRQWMVFDVNRKRRKQKRKKESTRVGSVKTQG
jgi:hypothetical protein